MRIYKDNIVRSKVFRGFRRTQKPTTIVIHGTAGGNTLNWWRNGHKTASGKRHLRGVGLTHFLILTNGKVVEIYDPATRWVYHSSTGKNDAGKRTTVTTRRVRISIPKIKRSSFLKKHCFFGKFCQIVR